MGKTRDLFKKTSDTKGTFNAKMGTIKDRKAWYAAVHGVTKSGTEQLNSMTHTQYIQLAKKVAIY